MGFRAIFPAVVLACAPAFRPLPDLLPLGHRPVVHELAIDEHAIFGQYRVVAGPVAGFHGLVEVAPGVPFHFSTKYGTAVYALPADAPMPADAPARGTTPPDWPDSVRTGAIPRHEVRSVPAFSNVHRILTTLRVAGVTDSEIVLEVVREERWDRNGHPISAAALPLLLAVAALGAAGVVALARSRPPATGQEGPG